MTSPGARDAERPVFVVGMPRSGTTLLSTVLDSHPRVAIAPETLFLSYWDRANRRRDLSRPAVFDRFWEKFSNHVRFPYLGVDPDATRARILAAGPPTLRSIFVGVLSAYADRFGKPRFGEKTPQHFRRLDRVFEWFPDARVAFLVRDPRGMVASLLATPWSHPWIDWYAAQWRESVAAWRRRADDPRVRLIRYEDLVGDPERSVRELCAFLGEEFDPGMLTREAAAHRLEGLANWPLEHQTRAMGPIDAASVGKWRQALSPERVATIEHFARRREMIEFGYEPAVPPLPAARAVALEAALAARRARHGAASARDMFLLKAKLEWRRFREAKP